MSLRVGVVVQRYGIDIVGGAELHARYIAEHLARHADVRVLTTCARDYVTWRNELPPGVETVNGIPVERYPVSRERNALDFGRRSTEVFSRVHSLDEELDWLDSEGPTSPELLTRLRRAGSDFDIILAFSVRYHHAYHAARLLPERTVLVPTAERDPALGLAIFGPIFRGVRAIMYNTWEERALIHSVAGNADVPGVVVGVGSEVPSEVEPARARQTFGLHGPFVVYVGRIDVNKGCGELFDYFLRYLERSERNLTLVLIGTRVLEIPSHPHIRHLGFVTDQEKFDVVAAAEALVMPSYYESLSMVALEAWALGRPVLANARCDVLLGHCLRSHAGLYYENAVEFGATLDAILDDPALAAGLGRNGRAYVSRHYDWPVIEERYLDMFARLADEAPPRQMEPLPGWFSRRRHNLPPASAVVAQLPSGPALDAVGTGAGA